MRKERPEKRTNGKIPNMTATRKKRILRGKRKKNDVAEECRFAYKDIDMVMAQQSDLVTPVRKLKTVGVVKG